MEKQTYHKPQLEVIEIETEEVMTGSIKDIIVNDEYEIGSAGRSREYRNSWGEWSREK